jgi:hypothetical protein
MKRFYFGSPRATTLARLALPGLLLLGLTAQARPDDPVTVTTPDAEHVRVRIAAPTGQRGRVQVRRLSSGQVLFDEAYAAPAYGHRFSFRDLPAGRYALLVQAGGRRYRYTFRLQQGPAGPVVTLRTLRTRGPELLAAAR